MTDTSVTGCDDRTIAPAAVPRGRHVEMLVISCVVLAASFLLNVDPGDRVHVAGLPDLRLPKTCLTRDLFGVDCPGCGLTRSFIHLTRWDWSRAWGVHRLGWLLFLATLLQIPYRVQALFGRNGSVVPVSLARACGSGLIALLVVNWLVGLLPVNAVLAR